MSPDELVTGVDMSSRKSNFESRNTTKSRCNQQSVRDIIINFYEVIYKPNSRNNVANKL